MRTASPAGPFVVFAPVRLPLATSARCHCESFMSLLFLLPPSETKRDGGTPDSTLDFDALAFPRLGRPRRALATAVQRLSRDPEAAMAALKIGPRLVSEVERNRLLKRSPTLRALERYTGVAYDPIDASALSPEAWAWAREHIAIHSALFALVGAADPIPAYRLSQDSRLPGLPLKAHWSAAVARVLADTGRDVVDLRSEGYAELGPAPAGSAFVRIVSEEGGRRRALNHFNKKTKGVLIARLLESRPPLESVQDFVGWARGDGIVVDTAGPELEIVSESVLDR